jgi:hypothetical protein
LALTSLTHDGESSIEDAVHLDAGLTFPGEIANRRSERERKTLRC